MINYEPFWATLQRKNITKYQLIYHWGISSNTLRRMSHNEAIATPTLNELCLILGCEIQDILHFEPSQEEQSEIYARRELIELRKNQRRKHSSPGKS